MTEERIKTFLFCFYEQYIESAYLGFEVATEDPELTAQLDQYDVHSYFLRYLDVYVQNSDFMKEYTFLYNPSLFTSTKEAQPESFNDLEIFLIENIQLFLHTILEAAIHKQILKDSQVEGLQIHMKPVDNKAVKLVDLVDGAEKRMKERNVMPPAMG